VKRNKDRSRWQYWAYEFGMKQPWDQFWHALWGGAPLYLAIWGLTHPVCPQAHPRSVRSHHAAVDKGLQGGRRDMTERGAAKLARKAKIEKAIDWIMAIIAGVTVVVGLGAGVWFLLQKGSG
jgi:hypothetical protein